MDNNQGQQNQQRQQQQQLPPRPQHHQMTGTTTSGNSGRNASNSPRRISTSSSTTGAGGGGNGQSTNTSPSSLAAAVAAVRHELTTLGTEGSGAATVRSTSIGPRRSAQIGGTGSTGTSPAPPTSRRSLEFAAQALAQSRQRRSMMSQQQQQRQVSSSGSAASSASLLAGGGAGPTMAGTAGGAGAMNASMALQAMTPATKIDNRPAVVIEIGTRLTRIGFAGEFVPREIFRTELLDPMDGPPPQRPQPVFDRRRGEQEQHEVLVKFLKNIVFRKLLTTVGSRRMLIVESLLTPTWQRQALARALFECPSLGPHSVLFAPSHLLCSFPFNARTCLVLDLGADEAVLFPIAEGVLMLNSWQTSSSCCATALEQNVKRLMLRYGRVLKRVHGNSSDNETTTLALEGGEEEETTMRRERQSEEGGDEEEEGKREDEEEEEGGGQSGEENAAVWRPLNDDQEGGEDMAVAESMRLWEDLLVRFCFVTTAGRGRRLQAHLSDPERHAFDEAAPPVRLQFGAELLHVPGEVREAAAELLFTQSDEPDSRSVAQLLLDCLAEVSIDLRRELLKNVLIVGGVSRLPGFLARLKTELLNLLADGYRPQLAQTLEDIKFYQFPKEVAGQLFCAWLGGSMFALDDTLDQRSLTKRQWLAQKRVPDWTNAIDAYFSKLAPPPTTQTTRLANGDLKPAAAVTGS